MIDNLYNNDFINSLYDKIALAVVEYWPKILLALIIIVLGVFISIWIYKFVIYLFKKFKIIELIDKLTLDFDDDKEEEKAKEAKLKKHKHEKPKRTLLSHKIKINIIVAKAFAYYIFLVFFRLSIVVIWITEVEDFLWDLLTYLPKLFLWVMILFFGIRFANFIYDITFHALDLAKQKTAKIIATWAKIIILFFTLMVALHYIDLVDATIINTILIGFISMLALAWWLAFWLGWKHIAKEILEGLKNK